MYSLSLALAMTLAPSSGVKWVPLNKANPTTKEVRSEQPARDAVQKVPVRAPAELAPTVASQNEPIPQAETAASRAAPVTDGSRPLELTCVGAGTASKASAASAWGYGGWAVITGHHDRDFNDQVDIRLFTGDDRIRIPRTMLPGIHGGDHGWFKLHNVVADARAIRASAGVGILHNPKVFIDRVTGTISISGKAGDYTGQCQAIDASAPAKF